MRVIQPLLNGFRLLKASYVNNMRFEDLPGQTKAFHNPVKNKTYCYSFFQMKRRKQIDQKLK